MTGRIMQQLELHLYHPGFRLVRDDGEADRDPAFLHVKRFRLKRKLTA